jgi:hypothetical protein
MKGMLGSFGGRAAPELAVALFMALLNGLLYLAVVPPWQHYDEPNHFEYVWLAVNRPGWPQPGDYDQPMRRAVAESMLAHHFFDRMTLRPNLEAPPDEPIYIGAFPTLDEPPIYYWLAGLPLRLLRVADVTAQLYLVRGVSLLLFLLTVLAGWGVAVELTPAAHPLRLLLPATLALLPGLADLMTAATNDVGAIAFFSLFSWAALRLVRRGFSLTTCLAGLGLAILCFYTKKTVFLALPLLSVALLFALFRRRLRWLGWGLLAAGLAGMALVVFRAGEARLWQRSAPQESLARAAIPSAPLGEQVFRLELEPQQPEARLSQLLPFDVGLGLRDQTLTLGAWIWATRPVEVQAPRFFVFDGRQRFSQAVQVGPEPVFFAFTFQPLGNPRRAWVQLQPAPRPLDGPLTVYYDGLVLAQGAYPADQVPIFDDPQGSSGTWDGRRFQNLLRNPSAELSWPNPRPWVDRIGRRFFGEYGGYSLSLTYYGLLDWPATGWYFDLTLKNLFRTFWAKFGWGNVALIGYTPYRWLAVIHLLGLLGAALSLAKARFSRRETASDWETAAWFGLAVFGLGLLVFIRGWVHLYSRAYPVPARYLYPAVIPLLWPVVVGWWQLLGGLARLLRLPLWIAYLVYGVGFAGLNAWSVISILRFYAA